MQCGTGGDHASVADAFDHEIEDNDILIMASDGVLDNMFDNDLIDCVKPNMDSPLTVKHQAAADCIAEQSFIRGNDKTFNSPFAIGAQKAGRQFAGGKLDDISVIVA